MLSHEYKCIFIHIPKCGGSSIEKFLKDNANALGYEKESGLEYKMRREGLAKVINLYSEYFTFTFIRNPFDRFVSLWKHSERGKGYYFRRKRQNLSLKEYAYLVKNGDLTELSLFDRYHMKKQSEFILDYNKDSFFGVPRINQNNCNFIGKLENMQEDFAKICDILGLKNKQLSLEMVSPQKKNIIRQHYSSYYDSETLKIVSSLYEEDIEYFQYTFDREKYVFDIKSAANILLNSLSRRLRLE